MKMKRLPVVRIGSVQASSCSMKQRKTEDEAMIRNVKAGFTTLKEVPCKRGLFFRTQFMIHDQVAKKKAESQNKFMLPLVQILSKGGCLIT